MSDKGFHTFVPYYEKPKTTPEIQNSVKMICDTFSVKYVKECGTCISFLVKQRIWDD